MNPILSQKGEIDLICNNTQRYVPIDGLENWQADALLNDQRIEEHETATRQCLQAIDNIAIDWVRSLTDEEKYSIKKRKSLSENNLFFDIVFKQVLIFQGFFFRNFM